MNEDFESVKDIARFCFALLAAYVTVRMAVLLFSWSSYAFNHLTP